MTKMNRRMILGAVLCAALLVAVHVSLAVAEDRFIIVQSTTSTQNSGLFEHILPLFTKKTGIEVRVVAVGTGQALKNAENGDGDVVLVHSKPDEEKFVADGWGVKRYDVMYNDFIVVGPTADPAKIAGVKDPVQAFKQIAEAKAPFASRADDSGTELKPLAGRGHRRESFKRLVGTSKRALAWRDPQHGRGQAGLHAHRSGNVAELRQQG